MIEELKKKMAEMEKLMDEFLKTFEEEKREKSLQKQAVFGVSISFSKDGKPVVQEFGNTTSKKGVVLEAREPLTDVIDSENEITVIAELPGEAREGVCLEAREKTLTIRTVDGKFFKQLGLPAPVEQNPAKSEFNNGILEASFRKKANG